MNTYDEPKKSVTFVERHLSSAARQAEGILQSRYGIWLLSMISFVESALLVPIITDPFLVAYILANRGRMWLAVVATTASSIIGGAAAYLMASSFYYFSIQFLSPEAVSEFNLIVERFQEGTFFITLLGAITPVPYTLVALGAGFVQGSFLMFLLASFLGRSFRYIIVGYVTERYGPQALEHIKRNLELFTAVALFAILGYLIVHFFM